MTAGPRWSSFVLLVAASGFAGAPLAAQEGEGTVQPPDVFRRVAQLRTEVEQLRQEMGKPVGQFQLQVRSAAPREVYFQALTLFRKADRLAFEHTGQRVAVPPPPTGTPQPRDVLAVVAKAERQLRQVKEKLAVQEPAAPPARDPTKTPTDVFRAIVEANHQLNLMLDYPFAPSDVFQQVQRAGGLASRLAERWEDADFPRQWPAFQRGQRPADVYRQLLACLARIRAIFEKSGLPILEIEVADEAIDRATPSDVYDLASVLVSELAYLDQLQPAAEPPPPVFYPGRKFPSHVHQAARLLEQQLSWLERRVAGEPDWLQRKAAP
ncbi:MAG: hypothetical protein GTO03_04115 [Planctomycetales bacterium]|nr:hypothetical protein [Planctomycetales bacterium]